MTRCWMSANEPQVLGQGCLEPITIVRADTQQCERFTMDSRVSRYLSSFRRCLSFFPSRFFVSLCLSLGPTWEPSPKLLPATNSGVWMLLPLPWSSRGALGPLSRDNPPPPPPFPAALTNKTRLPRITRSLAGGDTRRFRSLNTLVSPLRWPVFEIRAKPACLRVIECAPRNRVLMSRVKLRNNIDRVSSWSCTLVRFRLVITRAFRSLPRGRKVKLNDDRNRCHVEKIVFTHDGVIGKKVRSVHLILHDLWDTSNHSW